MTLEELTTLFRKLGAPNPDGWARSQHNEGIDQLARFVFLREAWRSVVAPGDVSWIDRTIENAKQRPGDPCADIGPALERLLKSGADRNDILEVVRVMQYELLFSLCYLLEDPGQLEPEVADLSWRLMRTNKDGEAIGTIDGLHESVLELDPSGREMRPQKP
jgi:hypothetical protein